MIESKLELVCNRCYKLLNTESEKLSFCLESEIIVKKIGLATLALFLFSSVSGYSHIQITPVQVDQKTLDKPAMNLDSRNNQQTDGIISERQAVTLARQKFEGNILRISLVGEGANRQYRIRMESEGRVFTVFVNASTGSVTGGN